MADLPLIIAAPIGSVMCTAIVALWRRVDTVAKSERDACKEQIAQLERRFEERFAKLEGQRDDYEERWRREVERGALMHAKASMRDPVPSPTMPPSPDWEEDTRTRNVRATIERNALTRAFVEHESTPPRPRQHSRPR